MAHHNIFREDVRPGHRLPDGLWPPARMYKYVTQSQTTACSPSRLSPSQAVHHTCLCMAFFPSYQVKKQAYVHPRCRELERFAGRRAQVEYIHARGVYAEYGDMENMSLQNGENPSVAHKKCKILVLKFSILLYTFPSEHLQRSREPRPPHSVYRSPAQDVWPEGAMKGHPRFLDLECRIKQR